MRRGIRFTVFVLIFACLLGTDYARSTPIAWEWLEQWRDVVVSACNSRDVQQVELVCLCVYLLAFTLRLRQLERSSPRPEVATWAWNAENIKTACLVGLCVATLVAFFFGPPSTRGTTDPIVLFWGLAVGKGVRLLKMSQKDRRRASQVQGDILKALLAVIAFSVLVQPSWWQGFQYHGQNRWQGLWWNPNTFGMLMALGLVLAVGYVALSLESKVLSLGNANTRHLTPALSPDEAEREACATGSEHPTFNFQPSTFIAAHWLRLLFLIAAAALCGVGLVKSYSRGAWLGALCGLGYLVWQGVQSRKSKVESPEFAAQPSTLNPQFSTLNPQLSTIFRRNWLPVSVILASVLVFALWSFRHTGFLVARRAFSVANVNDFSWRNRLVAYEGALQMMAAKPWFGFGWDQPKTVYEEFYMPTKLTDGRAIELNDCFMIGLTLGLPAVACFVGYLLLSVFPPWRTDAEKMPDAPVGVRTVAADERWLVEICRAGLIVLLVGFWLQRGLFWLALTVPFWVLLELGSVGTVERRTSRVES